MSAMDVFWAAPPVTRTLAASAFVTSALVYSNIIDGRLVVFFLPPLLKFPPQIWRLVTSFLITGPKFGILLDPFFIYQYGSSLETESSRLSQPGEMFVYLVFVCVVILIINATLFGGVIFTPALVLALAYTYAQEKPNDKITYFIATLRMKWLPYVMLLMTFFMQSPEAALSQGSGLVAAHLYDFLTRLWPTFGGGQNFIQTPAFVKRWFETGRARSTTRPYGTAFTSRSTGPQPVRGTTSGFSSGFGGMSSSWGSRGAGRRLGGD